MSAPFETLKAITSALSKITNRHKHSRTRPHDAPFTNETHRGRPAYERQCARTRQLHDDDGYNVRQRRARVFCLGHLFVARYR